MLLEINILCFGYQHRLTWMLSSLLQQKGEKPDIVISIAYPPDNGNPTTEKVIEFFRNKGLNIVDLVITKEQATNRAISRNIRAKNTNAEWLLFADCDLVYDQFFFEDLKKKLESDQFKNETKVIGADRHSLDDKFCIKYFEEDKTEYPCEILNVASITEKWPIKWVKGKETAAGYHQLINVKAMREKCGFYSCRENDYLRNTKSDRRFRIHMGGRVPMDTLKIFHLNHDRNGPDIQR
jgi:hypothetical protein